MNCTRQLFNLWETMGTLQLQLSIMRSKEPLLHRSLAWVSCTKHMHDRSIRFCDIILSCKLGASGPLHVHLALPPR